MYDLDTLSLVMGQPLFSRGVSRGAGSEFSGENGMKSFPPTPASNVACLPQPEAAGFV